MGEFSVAKLRRRVLSPVVVLLVSLWVAFLLSIYWVLKKDVDTEIQHGLDYVSAHIQTEIGKSKQLLTLLVSRIQQDREIMDAMKAGDRDALADFALPLFEGWQSAYMISHFFLADAKRKVLLRAHDPDHFGDVMNHEVITSAAGSRQTNDTLEIGSYGDFVLRVAVPLQEDGRLIGFAELGMNLYTLLGRERLGPDRKVFLILYKQRLPREAWERRIRQSGRESQWERFPSVVLAGNGDQAVPAFLSKVLEEKTHIHKRYHVNKEGDRYMSIGFLPLFDTGGKEIGDAVVVTDVTQQFHEFFKAILIIAAIGLALGVPVIGFIYWLLGRVQDHIVRSGHAHGNDITILEEAQADLKLAASVFRESPLGIIITDEKTKILQVNRAFTDITGYTAEEAIGRTPKILHSGMQDEAFYQNLWASLKENGQWDGEIWNRRKSGEIYPEWRSIAGIKGEKGDVTHYISSFRDITEKKLSEKRIHRLAHYDALTNLPNRALLLERMKQLIVQVKRRGGKLGVLFFDLDDFKLINDTMGHTSGDLLLQLIAGNLKECVREEDTVARLSGDEFVVVLPDVTTPHDVVVVSEKIFSVMREPLPLGGRQVELSFSLGISMYPDDGLQAETLLKHADIAMYWAKHEGKNQYRFFTQEMTQALEERLRLEEDLKIALEDGQFMLYFQPQIDLRSGRIIGVEALLRWRHPEHGLIPPFKFIPVAEDMGLILPLGRWVLEEACRQQCAWRKKGMNVRMAVNLSARQLQDEGLLDVLGGVLSDFSMDPAMLELELTETFLMDDPEAAILLLQEIKGLGLRLAMDDFGTGYSSLSYLKRFAMDTLKIDQSFVRALPEDEQDAVIITTIIDMAHNLDLKVLAEGVETIEQLRFLREHGCSEVQGYYFSKPLPAEQIMLQLRRNVLQGNHTEKI